MKRLAIGLLVYCTGYCVGRAVGHDECAKAVSRFLPPDASVSKLLHPTARRSSAWN